MNRMGGVHIRIKRLLSSRIRTYLFFVLALWVQSCTVKAVQETIVIRALKVETITNPLGIDVVQPHLSWELSSDRRGVEQTAYQILVASSMDKLNNNEGDLWNSGKVESNQSINVLYSGKRLESRMKCYWKVKVWSNHGESNWSAPAFWAMGFLNYKDWSGRWIGLDRAFPWDDESMHSRLSARYFRKEFKVEKEIKNATVYIMGLGLYELYINGKKVGDQVLAPTPTDYFKNVKYNVFDVTEYLRPGENAIGTVLGNGRYYTMRQNYKPYKIKDFGYPKMLLQLEIVFNDGTRQIIKTDDSWKVTADGPIRSNNEYDGEEYDARKEMPGWNNVGFNDEKWLRGEYVQEPGGEYEAQMNENMKVMKTLKPISIREVKKGIWVLDMGQNMVGWVKMRVRGARGDKVILRFAEILQEDGNIFTRNLRDALATDIYILKGGGLEEWEPSFTYHGFRYVEVTGYPGTPTVNDFEGRVVYDNIKTVGTFETSNQIINQIFQNAWWGIAGNYKGMPVDCPQRNERQPWLGDRPASAYGESFLFDNRRLYEKWLDDIQKSQKADGAIPDVAPAFWFYYSDNMTWPGTYLEIANMLYRQYGNKRVLEKHYPSMKKWLQYMRNRYMNEDYILTKDSYGDWCAPPPTLEEGRGMSANVKRPSMLISTAYYYRYMNMMQEFARLTGHEADIPEYCDLAEKVKKAFNNTFFNVDSSYYGGASLTDNILALSFGLVPDEHVDIVFSNVQDIIEKRDNGHLSSGVVGVQWLMRTLSDYGRPDLAYRLAANTTYPSWGYMIENGATTIWELWNGNIAAPNMNSYNHVMLLGDLLIWYYENLAGIRSSLDQPGFKQIVMKPEFPNDLEYVKAGYHSAHGLIRSEWKKSADKLEWQISIPGNTRALVYLPANSKSSVTEGGNPISSVKEIKLLRMDQDRAVIEIGSGDYVFKSEF